MGVSKIKDVLVTKRNKFFKIKACFFLCKNSQLFYFSINQGKKH